MSDTPKLSKALQAAVAATAQPVDFEEKMRNHLSCIVAPTPAAPAR